MGEKEQNVQHFLALIKNQGWVSLKSTYFSHLS